MTLSSNKRGMLIRALILVALGVAYFWLYPIVSSYFPRSYEVSSSTLVVTAKYYPLTIDGVDSVFVSHGAVVGHGYTVSFFKLNPEPPVSRKLPEEFSHILIPDTSWHLGFAITKVQGFSPRVFFRRSTGDSILVQFPAGNDYPFFAAYRGVNDTTLIAIGSGNWKRGYKAHLGYIVSWRKPS